MLFDWMNSRLQWTGRMCFSSDGISATGGVQDEARFEHEHRHTAATIWQYWRRLDHLPRGL
jgi:hypothetical protein